MSLLSQLLASKGITQADVAPNSKLGKHFGGEPVTESEDYRRIASLPRRHWGDVQDLSPLLRKTPDVSLFPMQSAVLKELYELRRTSCVAALGTGKTLVTALAPTILGVKRAAFLNYSRLMDKTRREFDALSKDWKVFRNYDFLTVECLSLSQYVDWFDTYVPELVVVDEAHSLANQNGARFKRLRRYKTEHPDTVILLLTGTPGVGVEKVAHLQALLHQLESPYPLDEWEVRKWGEAVNPHVRGVRRAPGVLGENLEAAREWIAKRVEETPGNIYHRIPDGVDCNLVHSSVCVGMSVEADKLCDAARLHNELPDGRCFEEMYDVGFVRKQLGCGFVKALDPAPPTEWREARQLLGAFVREIISQEEKYRLDTPGHVIQAVRRGEIDDGGLYAAWKEIEPSFTPVHVTEWFDDAVLKYCDSWLKEHKGLVWVILPTFGRKLAEVSGLPFFHALGVDSKVGSIETYTEKTGGILSLSANMLGRNLQDRWHKNLFVTCPASSTSLDQAIGRTVRTGQKAETVEVEYLFTVRENYECLMKARTEALAEKNPASRILLGDWLVKEPQEKGPRWEK